MSTQYMIYKKISQTLKPINKAMAGCPDASSTDGIVSIIFNLLFEGLNLPCTVHHEQASLVVRKDVKVPNLKGQNVYLSFFYIFFR